MNTKEFIKKSNEIHTNKYDYSKTEFKNHKEKVCIICPKHGEYWQLPWHHIKGAGCPKCAGRGLSNDEIIDNFNNIHNNKYDYSKMHYVDAKTKICIICHEKDENGIEHGEFWQKPCDHKSRNGCPKCASLCRKEANKNKKNTKTFIEECIKLYGEHYDYSKVNYVNAKTKVIIIDTERGEEFSVTPTTFLRGNYKNEKNKTFERFLKKAKHLYGDKCDYTITVWNGSHKKIQYICHKHGLIEQYPDNHIKGGCPKCSLEKRVMSRLKSIDEFINEAESVHGKYYDYSKVDYKGGHKKIIIICPKHGEFKQIPLKHIRCGHGCPKCKESHLERDIREFCEQKNIKYVFQYSPMFLKNGKGLQKIDFFLPDYNVAIECQGIQHFSSNIYISNEEVCKNIKRDIMKNKKCAKNGIQLLYYTTIENFQFKNNVCIYNSLNIFYNIEELFEKIYEIKKSVL